MAEGDIHTDGHDLTDQGTYVKHRSLGTQSFPRDALLTLHNLWLPMTQMLQVAPGHLWCKVCGNVRPKAYFDPTAWAEDGTPTEYFHSCKECVNAHDPKLRPVKYCSRCKQERVRSAFGDDDRNVDGKKSICRDCDSEIKRVEYRQKVGRDVRSYVHQA